MIKLFTTSFVALLALGSAAMADSENWNVTEEGVSGIKAAQGVWALKIDGAAITGKAEMQLQNGSPLAYKIEGKFADGVYTLNFTDRGDGKKDCVWSGHDAPAGSKGLVGDVLCDGKKVMIIRASH